MNHSPKDPRMAGDKTRRKSFQGSVLIHRDS